MTSKETLEWINHKIFELENDLFYCTAVDKNENIEALIREDIQQIKLFKEALESLEILKKYYKSDGWSNGGVIQFWGMSDSQLDKVKRWLEDDK